MLTKRQEAAVKRLPATFQDMASAVFHGTASSASAYIRTYCLICKQGSTLEIQDCDDEACALRGKRPFRIRPTPEQLNNTTPEGIQQ